MSGPNFQGCSTASGGLTPQSIAMPTLGNHLDRRIAETRKQLEQLCVIKAKAEAMQMLDYPREFLSDCIHS